MGTLQHEKAYDSILKKWVSADEVDKADRYDKPRFYSEENYFGKGNKGDILTFRKESKDIPYMKKELHPDKESFRRKQHFVAFCTNNAENREKLNKQSKAQESLVHKLAKQLCKDINFIKIPNVQIEFVGKNVDLINEQFIKVKYIKSEKKIGNRIPDIVFETEYIGKKEEIYLEIYYRHRVTNDKKLEFIKECKNCLEVDLSDLRYDLEASEDKLRKTIIDRITNDSYWISNGFKQFYNLYFSNPVIDLNTNGLLMNTYINTGDKESNENRLYIFKDALTAKYNLNEKHKCYFVPDNDIHYTISQKCTNIGDCKTCEHCLGIKEYTNTDTSKVHVYCIKDVEYLENNKYNLFNEIVKLDKVSWNEV